MGSKCGKRACYQPGLNELRKSSAEAAQRKGEAKDRADEHARQNECGVSDDAQLAARQFAEKAGKGHAVRLAFCAGVAWARENKDQ